MSKKKKAKKKKHLSTQERKQRAVKASYEFAERLEQSAKAMGLWEIYQELNEEQKKNFIDYGIDGYQVVSEESNRPDRKWMPAIRAILNIYLKKDTVQVAPDLPEISLYEYYTSGNSLYLEFVNLAKNKVSNFTKITTALERIKAYEADCEISSLKLGNILWIAAIGPSNITGGYYFFDYTLGKTNRQRIIYDIKLILKYIPPEIVNLKIDNINRPVYRLGWAKAMIGIDWSYLNSSDLCPESDTINFKLPVYVQSHAIRRLEERLDTHPLKGYLHNMLRISVSRSELHFTPDNKVLLSYYYMDVKLGYLLLELQGDKVLIKTFLFITQNGTPEGNKLNDLTGFRKDDKKYWALDKLSSFASNEIRSNNELGDLLERAGCAHLLTFEFGDMEHWAEQSSFSDLAKFFDKNKEYNNGFDFK